jgi:hypothetical protein
MENKTAIGWVFLDDHLTFKRPGIGKLSEGCVQRAEPGNKDIPESDLFNWFYVPERTLTALDDGLGNLAVKIKISGDLHSVKGFYKGRVIECLHIIDATDILHRFTMWCAEHALKHAIDPDPKVAALLQRKKEWLATEKTDTKKLMSMGMSLRSDIVKNICYPTNAELVKKGLSKDRPYAQVIFNAVVMDNPVFFPIRAYWAARRAFEYDPMLKEPNDKMNSMLEEALKEEIGQ